MIHKSTHNLQLRTCGHVHQSHVQYPTISSLMQHQECFIVGALIIMGHVIFPEAGAGLMQSTHVYEAQRNNFKKRRALSFSLLLLIIEWRSGKVLAPSSGNR